MFLLLFLLLQSSLVRHSLQDPHDNHDATALSGDLKGGFPNGTLLTLYLKMLLTTRVLRIDLYDDVDTFGGRLHFNLFPTEMISNVANVTEERKGWNDTGGQQTFNSSSPFNTSGTEDWWRFDLYKISETEFLPFFQGFHAHLRTMQGVKDSKSVFIWNFAEYGDIFDKNDAYVLVALDRQAVEKENGTRTLLMDFPSFPVNKAIKLSALMIVRPPLKESVIYFHSSVNGSWFFGIYNVWITDNNTLKLKLFVRKEENSSNGNFKEEDCTGNTTSTDLVHVKLERTNSTTIKMRTFWKENTAAGITCQITVGKQGEAYLNDTLRVNGAHGATLLYFSKTF